MSYDEHMPREGLPRVPAPPTQPGMPGPYADVQPVMPVHVPDDASQTGVGTWIGAAFPLAAAIAGLLGGMAVEVAPTGSWTMGNFIVSLVGVLAIGLIGGGLLYVMHRGWARVQGGIKLLLFLGLAVVYVASAIAAYILFVLVAITRDPPEC